jgi:serine/threonine protein kinase
MKTHLGHYDIVSELGRGGMGVVYKGFEGSLNRYVAIKVLADSLAHDEAIKERFLREARSMAALNDPHIIQIYFIGDDEGQTFFVMEFVDGESLGSVLKRERKLKPEQAAKVIYQTALGLSTAHDRGVIHRDIKPGNLMITSRGAIKIADFGIALSNHDLSKKLTTTGEFVGTPGYLSPEVCLGKPVDQRSDIFSLGIVLFEMLTGKMPFNDESPLGLMLEVVRADIPDVRGLNADVDPEIARILARMIAKDPADRYQSCHELVADLDAYPPVAKGGPITAQTKMSPAAETLIGQKTPVSGQNTLPRTPPTPLSMRSSGGGVANTRVTTSGQPQPPPVQQAAVERTTAVSAMPRRSALPWAIAALVLLGIAGGAYAYRGNIPVLAGLFSAPDTIATRSEPTHATTPAPAGANVTEVATSVAANDPASGVAIQSANPATVSTPPASATSPAAVAGVTPAQVAPTADANTTASAVSESSGAPAARASQEGMQALHELPAAQAAAGAAETAPQIAKIAPTQRPAAAPKPHVPTVAVVVAGDDVISAPAEEAVIDALQCRGFRVIEGGRAHGGSPNLGALAGRADAVVFVNARAVGTQEIQYYGQSSTLYTVQLGIKAYRVADRSVLWTGNTQQVNFTSLNAAQKAREAIGPMLQNVDSRLGEFRTRGRRG